MTRPRVFVRGVGAVSALGDSWPSTCAALAGGACAIRPITRFDAAGFPCTVAAEIAGPLPGDVDHEDRRRPLALAAAREAWREAALSVAPDRLGIFVGAESGRGSFTTVRGLARAAGGPPFDDDRFAVEARPFAARIDATVISPAAVAAALAAEWGAVGPVETISLACASGAAAIVEAVRAIRLGHCDVALAGGVGADVDPMMIAGFGLLGILSARGVSCPFDARRDGFVVGEGAAMIVLATEPGPSGAAWCEVAGVARTLDAYRLTAPEPDGDGAARAMTAALADAGVATVEHVQAHGTSTPLNDPIEVAAIRRALGAGADRAHVSSVKGALGHWVAGAGALGALCAIEAVAHGRILPTAGLATPDAACTARHVIGGAVEARVDAALVNAFAFGGANACLVMTRARGPW